LPLGDTRLTAAPAAGLCRFLFGR